MTVVFIFLGFSFFAITASIWVDSLQAAHLYESECLRTQKTQGTWRNFREISLCWQYATTQCTTSIPWNNGRRGFLHGGVGEHRWDPCWRPHIFDQDVWKCVAVTLLFCLSATPSRGRHSGSSAFRWPSLPRLLHCRPLLVWSPAPVPPMACTCK